MSQSVIGATVSKRGSPATRSQWVTALERARILRKVAETEEGHAVLHHKESVPLTYLSCPLAI
ncbi:hypothetical protein E4U56_007190 [Claviceps arundinis]|uniref:Uncharacterized protein n=1 Tax=Claviceps arundinis TaxID=1623583 RepID=A0A9P7SRE9_9HYPO|nr:hypothetical protein E4U56_007190 [Claviceps arundinis]